MKPDDRSYRVRRALTAACRSPLRLSACGTDSGSGGSAAAAAGTVASKMIFGGPAEFKTRPDGIPGLKKIYGVRSRVTRCSTPAAH